MKLKILTHFAHGVYQSDLAKVEGVTFYHIVDKEGKYFRGAEKPARFWSDDMELPENIVSIAAKDVDQDDFDLILVHWHPFIDQFATLYPKLPLIMLEHTWPYKNLKSEVLYWKEVRQKYCDHTVFITPSSRKAWGFSTDIQASHIYHSFDVDNFPQKTLFDKDQIMTTTNEFISRDWACGFSLWSNVLGIPSHPYFKNVALYGYGNKNIGKISKGSRTREEILDLLCNAGLYFNPSIMSPIPMSLLEAAAVGVPIVSTAYCEIGNIFKDREHGIISNDPITLREGIKYILNNSVDAARMTLNARNVVIDLFCPQKFRDKWCLLFDEVIKCRK